METTPGPVDRHRKHARRLPALMVLALVVGFGASPATAQTTSLKLPPMPLARPSDSPVAQDLDRMTWPADPTDQAKAIQLLLRDLDLYHGTTYGTVGPATRAAIRQFQSATGQAETGEPSEALFEALKKKRAAQ